ncbi:MAG: M48 family metalloprotease, partial [Thermoplasmata archaeon]|nr:M48 family metalloprotease [Thermoplasmata archaeon]
PREEYGYIYEITQQVSDKFDAKMPSLKMDESQDMNAYTTSIFGSGSVIVITQGLLNRVGAGRMSKDQLQAIIGHELGHIVNNDATITTLFNPAMMFVLAVKSILEVIVKGILFFIIASGKFGMGGVLRFILAIFLILILVWLLLYIGIYYVMFYIIALAIVVTGFLVSRQKEYAADLFGSLLMGSRIPLGTGLMDLTRETGFELVKRNLAVKQIEERTKKEGEDKVPEKERLGPEDKMKILEEIDAYEAVEKDPELLKDIPMRDARSLIESKGLEPFDEDDFVKFSKFEYTTQEKVGELMMSHPLMAKRAAGLNLIKLATETSQEE